MQNAWSRVRPAYRVVASTVLFGILLFARSSRAQDDVTTQNASSAMGGGWITGPASNPLSLLNGPANRTTGSALPYDFRDLRPASQLDAHLPKWLNFEAEERLRSEGYENASFKRDNNDSYFLNRFRLQADVRLGSWFTFVSQVQDARPFLETPRADHPNENRWDVKLAYAELGDPQKHWFSLRVGRQVINYNNTLIANSEWRNPARSYDAAVVNLQHRRYHLGVFAASVVTPLAAGISHHRQGNNIYGLYGRIDNFFPNSSIEPFILWRLQPNFIVEPSVSSQSAHQDMKTFGVRFKGHAMSTSDYSIEAARQTGKAGTEQIRAWALTGGAAYQLRSLWAEPRLFAQYDYATGKRNAADGVHRTFDTLFPTAHDRFGITDLFGWQNIRAVRTGGTLMPHQRFTVTAQYVDFWVASAADVVYNTSGGLLARGPASGKSDRHLGEEVDVYSWYELNGHLNIGAGYARFSSGAFLSQTATANGYSYPYFVINFKDHGRSRSK